MPTTLLLVARAFHFGAGMILAGVVAFRWLVLLPAFARETDETWQEFAPFFRKLHTLFVACALILALSGLALFWAVAADMSGASLRESLNGDTLRTVFFQTQFGLVCQWRLGFILILAIVLWGLARARWQFRRKSSLLEIIAAILATALIVSVAWTGHAAAAGLDFRGRVLADAAHLFAASIWPTGLLPLALFLGCARQLNDLSNLHPTLTAVRRFSTVSFITVGLLTTTGLINACFIVGNFLALFATDYGRLLCLKLFLFLLILGIAACNRYHLLPRLFAQAALSDKTMVAPLLRRLQRFVTVEFALSIAVVMVVSLLGTTPPPH